VLRRFVSDGSRDPFEYTHNLSEHLLSLVPVIAWFLVVISGPVYLIP